MESETFPIFYCIEPCNEVQSAFYPVGTGGYFMGDGVGVKSNTPETDRSFLSGTDFKIYRSVLHGVNIVTN